MAVAWVVNLAKVSILTPVWGVTPVKAGIESHLTVSILTPVWGVTIAT